MNNLINKVIKIMSQVDENIEKVDTNSIIKKETLEKTRYERTFPKVLLKTNTGEILTPTTCFSIFEQIDWLSLSDNSNNTYTGIDTCFRNEKFTSVNRKRSFLLLEYVFVGREEFVKQKLLSSKKLFLSLLKLWNIKADVTEANDAFFLEEVDRRKEIMAGLQTNFHGKEEISTSLNGSKVAVASSNYHDKKYIYTFCPTNKNLRSGCFGIGLDRLMNIVKVLNE